MAEQGPGNCNSLRKEKKLNPCIRVMVLLGPRAGYKEKMVQIMVSEASGDGQQVVVSIWGKQQKHQALTILIGECQMVKDNTGVVILSFMQGRQASHQRQTSAKNISGTDFQPGVHRTDLLKGTRVLSRL